MTDEKWKPPTWNPSLHLQIRNDALHYEAEKARATQDRIEALEARVAKLETPTDTVYLLWHDREVLLAVCKDLESAKKAADRQVESLKEHTIKNFAEHDKTISPQITWEQSGDDYYVGRFPRITPTGIEWFDEYIIDTWDVEK